MVLFFLFFNILKLDLNFRGNEISWRWKKGIKTFSEVSFSYPLTYLGPEGGMIVYPITSEVNLKKVVLPSLLEYHKCENVFAGDTFEIAIPYSGNNFRTIKSGVMTSNSTFLLLRDYVSYFFTNDNFQTVNTITLNSKIGAIDNVLSHVYMIVGDSLLQSLDGGNSFNFVKDLETVLPVSNYNYLLDVYPFNSNIIAILARDLNTSNYYFLYSTDGGSNFNLYLLNISGDALSMRFSPSFSNVIFLTTGSAIYYTVNAGTSFNSVQLNINPPFYPAFVLDVLPIAGADSFLFSSLVDVGIYKAKRLMGNVFNYTYIDTTFIPFFFEPTYRSSVLNDTFYVGSNDGVYYTTDRGKTWIRYKKRLKALLLMGPGQVASKRDTSYLISEGGITYRSYDLINQGFNELPFKGNLIFFGNNLVENFYFSSKSLYLLTHKIRVLGSPIDRILFFSNDAGGTFSLRSSDTSLLNYIDILPGRNQNTIYLYNPSDIIKSTDGGITFSSIYNAPIRYSVGENDTIFVLKQNDSLYASFDGSNFNPLSKLQNSRELYYVRGLPYVLYPDTLKNYLMYLDLSTSQIDTAIKRPNSNSLLIHSSMSYDGYVYSLFIDTLTMEKRIYYKKMPDGALNSFLLNLQNPVGIIALNNFYVLIYEFGRVLYITRATSVSENQNAHFKLFGFSYSNGNTLKFKGIKDYLDYKIFDLSGRVLDSGILTPNDNALNLNNLISGTYYIRLKDRSFKFIKF